MRTQVSGDFRRVAERGGSATHCWCRSGSACSRSLVLVGAHVVRVRRRPRLHARQRVHALVAASRVPGRRRRACCFRAWPLASVAGVVVVAHLAWVVPPLFRTVRVSAAAASAPRVRIVSANLRFDNTGSRADARRARAIRRRRDRARGGHAGVVGGDRAERVWPVVSGGRRSRPRRSGRHGDPLARAARRRRGEARRRLAGHHRHPDASAAAPCTSPGVHVPAPLETFGRNQRAQTRRSPRSSVASPAPGCSPATSTRAPTTEWHQRAPRTSACATRTRRSVGRSRRPGRTTGSRCPRCCSTTSTSTRRSSPVRAREGQAYGSDHRPIVVDLAIAAAPARVPVGCPTP